MKRPTNPKLRNLRRDAKITITVYTHPEWGTDAIWFKSREDAVAELPKDANVMQLEKHFVRLTAKEFDSLPEFGS